MKKTVQFYRVREKYGCFSNFSRYNIQIRGKNWPTAEHFFQAQKFAGTVHEEAIRLAKSPITAARMGRERTKLPRSEWEIIRDDIMREAVYSKFWQHPDLLKILVETGDAILIEHTSNDSYWADGGDGTGKNMLGKILMEVREFERGNHPSFSWDYADDARCYVDAFEKYLYDVGFVKSVNLGYYHDNTLILNVILKDKVPMERYRCFIPDIFRGFQVIVIQELWKS